MSHQTKGVFFGKFAPLHTGHVQAIIEASTRVDELHVVLCWDEKFQEQQSPRMQRILTRSNRMKWLFSTFQHISNIHITFVDETPVLAYPHGFTAFADLLRNVLPLDITDFFSSERDYSDFVSQEFPQCKHTCIDVDRVLRPVSATFIRTHSTEEIWQYLPKAVREDFALRVAIIGIESTGKSTATATLAQIFETEHVEEVGRTLCENEMFSSEFAMSEFDYTRIAIQHRHKENLLAQTCNKVLISDTNNFITFYSSYEMGITSSILYEMSILEHYDLILFLDSNVPWVYDPLRRKGSVESRKADSDRLNQAFEEIQEDRHNEYNVFYVDSTEYSERIQQCKEEIEKLLSTVPAY